MTKEKKVPELRFPGFTGEWEEKKLGDILEFKNGLNKAKEYFGSGTPIVNYMDVNRNKLLERKDIEGLVNVNKSELDRFKVIKGDVFFTRTSETIEEIGLASVVIEDIDNCVYSGFLLRGRNITKNMDNKFSGYFYNTERIRKEIMRKSSKTTRALTNGVVLSEVKVMVPTKEEQGQIGSFLYTIDQKIDLQKKRIEELKTYKKGMMQRIFDQEIRFKDEDGQDYPDWEEKRLGEISKLQGGYAFKSIDYRRDGVPIIRISNIMDTIDLNDDIVYSKKYDIPNQFIIKKGDLLIAMSGATTGKVGIYKHNSYSYLNQRCGKFIGYEDLFYPYLYSWVKSDDFRKQLSTRLIAGAQPNISGQDIETIFINFPSFSEQEKIASFLLTIDKKIELEEERLECYEKFKKGLMQIMFV